VFSAAVYDPAVSSRIRWRPTPELDLASVPTAGISGKNGYLRVSSFAECNGRLYAAVGQQIYERTDGVEPHWRLLYTNHYPGRISRPGLRGLTAVASPADGGEVLLAAVEGNAPLDRARRSARRQRSHRTRSRRFSSTALGHAGQLCNHRLQRHGEDP